MGIERLYARVVLWLIRSGLEAHRSSEELSVRISNLEVNTNSLMGLVAWEREARQRADQMSRKL